MLSPEAPERDPRAEIVEISSQAVAWPDDPPEGSFRGRTSSGSWLTRRRAAAAGAALVLIAGVALASQSSLFSSPGPNPAPGLPSPPPAPETIFPATAAGLPVVGIDVALARDQEPASGTTELAVRGWYTAKETLAVCHPTGVPYVPCGELWTTRLVSAATPWFGPDGSLLPPAPGVVALQTVFVPPLRKPDLAVVNPLQTHPTIAPTPLVLIGHFHDDRATGCPAPVRTQAVACDPGFMVDAVADLTGLVRPSTTNVSGLAVGLKPADVIDRIRGHVRPGGTILEFGPVVWFSDGINFSVVESDPHGPPADARYVWLARGYLNGSASWLAIDDITGQLWGPLTTSPSPIPVASGIPAQIGNLPVQSVSGVLQELPPCCQLVAVGGYLSSDRAPEGCPPERSTGKPTQCSDTQLALVDTPGPILERNDTTFLYGIGVPAGTAVIRPVIPAGTNAPDPWAGVTGLAARVGPRQVVLIGQFGDPRSPECAPRPGGGSAGCDLSFVVDQIAWMNGDLQPRSTYLVARRSFAHTPDQIVEAVQVMLTTGTEPMIVSITATTPADSLALTGIDESRQRSALLWVVRYSLVTSGSVVVSGYSVLDDATEAVVDAGQ